MTQRALHSESVPRRPNKAKKGQPFRLNLVLPGDLVESVDEFARQLAAADPYGRDVSRTDAIKVLLFDGLKSRKPQK